MSFVNAFRFRRRPFNQRHPFLGLHSDVTVNAPGLAMAVLFIVAGGSQQILCGHMQTTLKLQSHQLMSNTSFLQVRHPLARSGQNRAAE